MRTIVELPEAQLAQLRELCEAQGISRAEAVRRAIALLLAEHRERDWERVKAVAFGSWAGSGLDPLEFHRRFREELER